MKKNALARIPALILCLGLLSGCAAGELVSRFIPTPTEPDPRPEKTVKPSEEPEDDGAWQEILEAMPYCGDAAACRMTARQALAYAQLLADGIAGKAPRGEYYYGSFLSDVFFWDTPTTVFGYSGEYQTDRADVILGDFAGDGRPYLCVISSLHPEAGFDVYYADRSDVHHVYGDEAYQGRVYTSFALDKRGRMTISTGGSSGAASNYSAQYGVQDGAAVELYSYSEDYDWDTDLMHVTINGEETVYTLEEWQQLEPDGSGWDDTPSADYTPIPLRAMIDYLNQYAAAKGSSKRVKVAERSDESRMAEAMLNAMDSELSGWGSDEARLVDLDGDGLKELVVFDGNQAWLHYWKNGQLNTRDIGFVVGGWVEWWICQDAATGELGIEYRCNGGGDFIGGASTFHYLSHEIGISDYRGIEDGAETRYYVNEVQVSPAEHQRAVDQNQRLEEFILESGPGTHIEETRAELNALL